MNQCRDCANWERIDNPKVGTRAEEGHCLIGPPTDIDEHGYGRWPITLAVVGCRHGFESKEAEPTKPA